VEYKSDTMEKGVKIKGEINKIKDGEYELRWPADKEVPPGTELEYTIILEDGGLINIQKMPGKYRVS